MLPSKRAVASSTWAVRSAQTAGSRSANGAAIRVRHYATPVDGPIEGDGVVPQDSLSRGINRGNGGKSVGPRVRKVPTQPYIRARERLRAHVADQEASSSTTRQAQRHSSPGSPTSQQHAQKRCLDTYGRACTVLTSSPHSTPFADLLSHIPPLDPAKIKATFGLFVFLVTPAYASTVRLKKDLVEQTIQRIYPRASGVHGLHSLVAVVDRLPRPTASPLEDGGSEGVAFMFTDDVADAPGLFDEEMTKAKAIRDIASSFQVRRSLTFDIVSEQTYEHTDEGESLPDSRLYSIQVPLANTIFQNGLPSTLIHNRYDRTSTNLVRTSSRHLNSQTLRVPFFAADEQASNLNLIAPLVPLTSARCVVACMGNIVRRLSVRPHNPAKESEDETILASHELEESVQTYFKARDIPPRTVSVWALVIPKEAFSIFSNSMVDVLHPRNITRRWMDNTLNWVESVKHTPLSLLQHHVRLHKVLSGGGGWGKKAGLLSLDPDSSYTPDESSSYEEHYFAGLNLDTDSQESALREIVSPGDYIQFYISPTASGDEVVVKQDASDAARSSDFQSADFGTIPSTIDNIPEVSSEPDNVKSKPVTHANHFGALSEVGIALTISKHGKETVEQLNQTKVDVPFGRLSLRSRGVPMSTPAGFGDAEQRKSKVNLWDGFKKGEEPVKRKDERPTRIDFTPTKPMRFIPASCLPSSDHADTTATDEEKALSNPCRSAFGHGQLQKRRLSMSIASSTNRILVGNKTTRTAHARVPTAPCFQFSSSVPGHPKNTSKSKTPGNVISDESSMDLKIRQDQKRKERPRGDRIQLKETEPKQNHQAAQATVFTDVDHGTIGQTSELRDVDRSRGEAPNQLSKARSPALSSIDEGLTNIAKNEVDRTSIQEMTPRTLRIRKIQRPTNSQWNSMGESTKRNAQDLHTQRVDGRLAGKLVRKVMGPPTRMVLSESNKSATPVESNASAERAHARSPIRNAKTVDSGRGDSGLCKNEMHLPEPSKEPQSQRRKRAEIEDSVRQLLGL